MAKEIKTYQKSPTPRSPEESPYSSSEMSGAPDPDIDLERGDRHIEELERDSPTFKRFMDKLREAAKKVVR